MDEHWSAESNWMMRGLMLVWIALTHLPTAASAWVNQPFGFIWSGGRFHLSSALFTGRIYFRVAERDGYGAMTRKLWARTLRLYGYHCSSAGISPSWWRFQSPRRQSPRTSQSARFLLHGWTETGRHRSCSADLPSASARHSADVHHLSIVDVGGDSAGPQAPDGSPSSGRRSHSGCWRSSAFAPSSTLS